MRLLDFLRMSQWARRPPSTRRIKMVFGVIFLLGVIAGLEAMGWWPEAFTAQKIGR